MADSFYTQIPLLSDNELEEYIHNYKIYTINAIDVAIAEYRKRGRDISESEVAAMRDAIIQRDMDQQKQSEADPIFTNWKRNVVDDPEAPRLYSERAIWTFSAIMSPLFGVILLSMNLYKLGKKSSILPVLSFGVLWYVLALYIIPANSQYSISYLVSALGGAILYYFFWPKFIGKEFKYRRRPILIPLIIAVGISALLILAMIAAKKG